MKLVVVLLCLTLGAEHRRAEASETLLAHFARHEDGGNDFIKVIRQRQEVARARLADPVPVLPDDSPSLRDILGSEQKGVRNTHPDCSTDPMIPVMMPSMSACPAECPFSVGLTSKKCSKVCVSEGRCADFDPVLHFGDPITRECVPTCGIELDDRIPGCSKCASIGICEECAAGWGIMPGYTLSRDATHCFNTFHHIVQSAYYVAGAIAVIVLVYLVSLSRRGSADVQIKQKLEHALEHRERGKPIDPVTNRVFGLFTDGPWVFYDDISGAGIMHYFTWNAWMVVMAIVLAIGAYFSYEDTKYLDNMEATLDDLACYAQNSLLEVSSHVSNVTDGFTSNGVEPHALAGVAARQKFQAAMDSRLEKMSLDPDDPLAKYFDIDDRMFKFLLPCYMFLFAATIVLANWQKKFTAKFYKKHTGLKPFAAIVKNIPANATNPQDVLDHIRQQVAEKKLPCLVLGVSIAYDVFDSADDIDRLIEMWEDEEELPKQIEFPWYSFAQFDSLFVEIEPAKRQDKMELLQNLQTSGSCIVICNTSGERDDFVNAKTLAPMPGSTEELTLSKSKDEPTSVLWKNWSRHKFWPQILKGSILFVLVIAGWLALYLPYAMDYVFYASIPGQSPSASEDFILGMLIALGNAIVGYTVEMVVDYAGIRNQGSRNCVVLFIGFGAVFLNTVLDIWLVMEVAKGASLDAAFEGHRVGYDASLASFIVALIVPGYLIIPYIAVSIFNYALPYGLAKWIVGSRHVSHRQADSALEAPPFDAVWRYIDFVNNMSICLIMLMFTSPQSWTVMCTLVCSYIGIFMLDRFLLLRATSQTMYTSGQLSDNFARLFALPLGILGGITAWWGVKAGILPPGAQFAAFVLSIPLYIALLEGTKVGYEKLRKKTDEKNKDQTYGEVTKALTKEGKTYNYWNTNPAQCLRNRYLKEDVPGCHDMTPYVFVKHHQMSLSSRKQRGEA